MQRAAWPVRCLPPLRPAAGVTAARQQRLRPAVLATSGYSVSYRHTCASVAGAQGIDAGMLASICYVPGTGTGHESWVVGGYPVLLDRFADADLGAAIRGWTIVGGAILATKDFSVQLGEAEKAVTVQTNLVLFHKPLP